MKFGYSLSRKHLLFGSSLFTMGTIAFSGISGIMNSTSVKAEDITSNPSEVADHEVENSLPAQGNEIEKSVSGKNKYLDIKDYQTNSYEPPTKVIITERRSQCQTVIEHGHMVTGQCNIAQNYLNRTSRINRTNRINREEIASIRQFNPNRERSVFISRDPDRFIRRGIISPNVEIASTATGLETAPLDALGMAAMPLQYNRATVNPAQIDNRTSLLFPLAIPGAISSPFGWRVHPITGVTRLHAGTDIAAPEGTLVLAAYPGQVQTAGWSDGYGLMVSLLHEKGTQESRYGHLSQIFVQLGEWVQQGAVIGRVGSTGMATGPHLHFEWRHLTAEGSIPVDAGVHLQFALNNLIYTLERAQANSNNNHT
jgi:murein DD-endopeptidase MepM/ murein hydrolase activator NlpD